MTNNKNRKIVTRFAPSPTGLMHVGGVRTALYSWLWARRNNGTFILRIEDTDKEREVSGSIDHIMESLKWLGIDWDEGPKKEGPHAPYIQSERLHIYRQYAQILIDKGCAYPDPYTQEELDAFRAKADEEKRPFLYREHRTENPGTWDGHTPLRFKVPTIKRFEWHDMVYGDLSAGEEALDDFILIKGDGYPTYNFAHIVDDIEMGVTHVMRGQEFISSTPKFLSVYEALDVVPPVYATLPPIMGPDGKKKLSKRDEAADLFLYKDKGYLPNAVVNFLAFLGWNPGDEREILSVSEIITAFDIERIQKSPAGLNEERLKWTNREHLKLLSFEEQEEYIAHYLSDELKSHAGYTSEHLHNITPILMERITCGDDIKHMETEGELGYFFDMPTYINESLFGKTSKLTGEDRYAILAGYLEHALTLIKTITNTAWNKETLKADLWPYAEIVGRGELLYPIRFSLSGKEKSPDPFTLAEVLGKEETIKRIENAIHILKKS